MAAFPVDEFVQAELDSRLGRVEEAFGTAAMTLHGSITSGIDLLIRECIEHRAKRSPDQKALTVVLTTGGGYIEVTQRIVETIRHHYSHVNFVIPDVAYSAGTVLAMSGDAIYMDYFSRMGPIDPQVENAKGELIPALGYLERYEGLLRKADEGKITLAEVQLLIDGFNQAELYMYDQARELSISLLKKWLVEYKFKEWSETETRKIPVSPQDKEARAEEIARQLNETGRWHSHGHGISATVLEEELKLRIDDFGETPRVKEAVHDYHTLLTDYLSKTEMSAVHVAGKFLTYHSHH